MTALTPTQQASIAATVNRMQLAKGLGDEESACSIAAINLALSGELTDEIPDCMSHVVGRWIIAIQDRMPDEMRNSSGWKRLLPLAAGTGRDHEPERLAIVMDWMWSALTMVQPIADANGFGSEWQAMCRERSAKAADTAYAYAAAARTIAAAIAARHAAFAISNASYLAAEAAAAATAARTIAAAIAAARTARITAAHSTVAARTAAVAARTAAAAAAATDSWHAVNPPALLERLINVSAVFA